MVNDKQKTLFPNDWETIIFGDYVDIYRGGSPRPIQDYLTNINGVNWIKIGDVKKGEKYITSTREQIIPEGITKSRKVQIGDFIISNSMSFGRPYILAIDGCIHDGWLTIQNYQNDFDREFLYYYLSSNIVQNQYLNMAAGSSVKNLNKEKVSALRIVRPPKREQELISASLSCIDEMVQLLVKLIEKKKAVMQGAMNSLLSRITHISRFNNKWEHLKFYELGIDVVKGQTITKNNTVSGIIPVVAGGKEPAYYCNTFNRSGTNITISASGASAGFVNIYQGNIFASDCSTISENNKYNIWFIYYLLLNLQNKIYASQTGGAQPHIHPDDIYELDVDYTFDIDEQTAIADILVDMDNEIAELEQKLAKYRQLKQGMMEQLLTGKIRLVESEDATSNKTKLHEKSGSNKPTGHNQQFDDAVVIAGIVNAFYSQKYPLGRKKVQKLLYLMRRKQEADTSAFKKKAAGPYADEIRYKGGEPIANKNGYITTVKSNRGTAFKTGKNIQTALSYIDKWQIQSYIDWLLNNFKYTKTDDLELFATVDMAICDLINEGKEVSVSSIKSLIDANAEWKAKLSKPYFSDNNIERAINECKNLISYA